MAAAEDVLFQKHDELRKDVTDLQIKTGVFEKMLQQHAEEFRNINQESAESRAAIIGKLDEFKVDLGSMKKEHYIEQGVRQEKEKSEKRFQWGVGIALSIITILLTMMTINGSFI